MPLQRSQISVKPMETRSFLLTLALGSILSAAAPAAAAAPDTSNWACSKCPFDRSYRSEVEGGGAYVDESSAKFGDYTGLDEKGGYLILNAEGGGREESGYYLDYELRNLGLSSREVGIEGGKQGQYEFALWYDRVPHTIWDTTATPYTGNGSTSLSLPADWVTAGSTAGMTALPATLHDVDVGYDRDRYGASGRFWAFENLKLDVMYRRDDRSGTRTRSGAFGSTSTEMLRPIDDTTDRLNVDLRYEGKNWFLSAGFYGSLYDTKAAQLTWDNPFTPMVAGADVGRMALEPDNQYYEFNASGGWYGLPWDTTLAVSVATGDGKQDTGFLPWTINPTIATGPLPYSNLDGKVTTNRADLTVTSRPIDRLRLRGSIAWDERDNKTRQTSWTSIVFTDMLPMAQEVVNPAYDFERTRYFGSADFEIFDQLTVGAGGEYRELKRTGTPQEVRKQETADGWGWLQYRPSGYLGILVKGGARERTRDGYDEQVAGDNGQNPLMRMYHMAYLYQSYVEGNANLSLGKLPLTLGASGYYSDDSYNLSQLGATSGLSRRWALDLTWAVNDHISAWVNGGQERIAARTFGSSSFSDPDWHSVLEDDYVTYGGGFRAQFADDVVLDVSYTHGDGDSTTTIKGVNAGKFPAVSNSRDTFKAEFTYGLTERMDTAFMFWHERYSSDDWAIAGIAPDTLPTVLSLGADPYDYSVNYVGVSLRYYFGPRGLVEPE
jgi:MtrB/PioB family decaheme-associated outer membrane protein